MSLRTALRRRLDRRRPLVLSEPLRPQTVHTVKAVGGDDSRPTVLIVSVQEHATLFASATHLAVRIGPDDVHVDDLVDVLNLAPGTRQRARRLSRELVWRLNDPTWTRRLAAHVGERPATAALLAAVHEPPTTRAVLLAMVASGHRGTFVELLTAARAAAN